MQFGQLKRRECITLLGGAAAWPLAAQAQQPAMPVVGFLNGSSAREYSHLVTAFHKGLNEIGYVEGRNVGIEYRWSENDYDQLPALASDLVRRQVTVIAANSPAALPAKQFDQLKRRDFITLLGGVAAWPLAARAQQPERLRRIGVLMNRAADDPFGQARLTAFQQALQQLGWNDGRNARFDIRWHENDADQARTYAQELIALAPDILLADGTVSVAALQHVTRALPIVFAAVADRVGAGLSSIACRGQGGNITGFMNFEYGFSGKWLELLKQIAPQVTRAAVIRDPAISHGTAEFSAIQAVAPALGVEVIPIGVRDSGEIERAVEAFARSANGGLIGAAYLPAVTRDLIITLAARHKLPAVYPFRYMVAAGGLVSYGPDLIDEFQRAAGYVDRILKGAKPADLPVQAPTKYELVVNLKTAKALGLERPASVLARADEALE